MPQLDRTRVRSAMRQARMKRADLSGASGIEPKTLTNALGANHQSLDSSKVQAICDVLGLSYEEAVADEQADGQSPADEAAGTAAASASTTATPSRRGLTRGAA